MHNTQLLLNILNTVRYEDTLTTVAARLYLSQPYVSKIIKEAEQKYGMTLILRNKVPITLTDAGTVLLQSLTQIENTNQALAQRLETLKRHENETINIAFNQPVASTELARIATHLKASFPDNRLNFFERSTSSSESLLLTQQMDIVVGPRQNNPAFVCQSLDQTQVGFLISNECRVYEPGRFIYPYSAADLSELSHYDYIGLSDRSLLQQQLNALFEQHHIQVEEILSLPDIFTATRAAYDLKTTTLTTMAIAATVIQPDEPYNIMMLPPEIIVLDNTVIHTNKASTLVADCSHVLWQLLSQTRSALVDNR